MRNPVLVKPYRSADEARCLDLLKQIFGDDDASQRYYRFVRHRTYLAVVDGRLVGLASWWDNPIHPYSLRSGVAVLPFYRRQGIGEQLWESLGQTDGECRSLVTALWETQVAGYNFAVRHRFVEIRRTHTAELKLGAVDVSAFTRWGEDLLKQGYRILPYSEATEDERAQMAHLLLRTYEATHRANPLGTFSRDVWRERAFPEDLLAWGSVAVKQGDRCAAVALLHKGTTAHRVEFGLRGVDDGHQHRSRLLMVVTTAHQIAAAGARGFVHASLECDSTDPWSRQILDSFPFGPAPTWITLRRE